MVYLVIIASGIFAEFLVRQSLIVPGDASATAANILAAEPLFRAGIAADLIMVIADVGVGLLFYLLLREISHALALLAAFFRLAQAAVLGLNLLNLYVGLAILRGAEPLAAFAAGQRHALALPFLEAHGTGYALGLVFFGVSLFFVGYLLLKSRYVPRILAVLLLVASCAYLADSFARTLLIDYRAVQPVFDNIVLVPAGLAEISLAVWLLVRGVDVSSRDSHMEPTRAPAPKMAT